MNIYELKEKSHHGRDNFPLQVYHPTGLMASYHWHEECEFIYVRSGNAVIRKSLEYIEVKEGQSVYIKPNELHAIHSEDMNSFDFYAIVFNPLLLFTPQNISSQYISSKYIIQSLFGSSESEKQVTDLIIKICHAYEYQYFAYELVITSHLYTIFAHIFEQNMFETKNSYGDNKNSTKLESIIKYIHTNYLESISIEELADFSGYSNSHFTRFFKKMTGNSPIEYLNRQRIYYACQKLRNTDRKILDIAFESGFNHIGHFIKTFTKYIGSTPHKYRQVYRNY